MCVCEGRGAAGGGRRGEGMDENVKLQQQRVAAYISWGFGGRCRTSRVEAKHEFTTQNYKSSNERRKRIERRTI